MPRVFEDHVQILVLCMENSSSKILFPFYLSSSQACWLQTSLLHILSVLRRCHHGPHNVGQTVQTGVAKNPRQGGDNKGGEIERLKYAMFATIQHKLIKQVASLLIIRFGGKPGWEPWPLVGSVSHGPGTCNQIHREGQLKKNRLVGKRWIYM